MTPERIYRILKFFGRLSCTWPPEENDNKFRRIINDLQFIVMMTNVIALLVPLMCGVYHNRHHVSTAMKALSELTALGDVLFNLILCRVQRDRLRGLLMEVNTYANTVEGDERKIFHRSVNQYLPFCAFVGLSYLQTAIAFSFGPLVMSSILPGDTWYPFPIEIFSTVYFLVYIQQVVAIIQTGMCITVDFMVAYLLSYLSARLQILNIEFRRVGNRRHLHACIKQHLEFIRFTGELRTAVRFIIVKGIVTMAMAAIFGAFPIIENEPLPVISQFILMVIGGCLRLYVSAWPADDVREMSERIGWSSYASPWIGSSREMQRAISIVVHRAHRPLVIAVHGILPALTLKFYASFLSSTLSYFMTLRAVLRN
ncbi:uncharacterized protein LOC107043060 [Diachasma alloeum]|uniref:Odorant receptor n=1 Tax=Diachasma alloeum TaxID=454923 RepID=A0A4E0RM11_9HYME|nr:uncharacterized protein LOC107043060 [Diachasma alloeum]THK33169.1 odorant receptor 66 [Diachasma alloeum]